MAALQAAASAAARRLRPAAQQVLSAPPPRHAPTRGGLLRCSACSRRMLSLLAVGAFAPLPAWAAAEQAVLPPPPLSSLPFAELEAYAKASYRRRELEEALAALSELVSREPEEPVWRERRAQVLLDLRRFADSVAEFDAASSRQPAGFSSLGLLSNRALALEGLARYSEAEADYSRSLQLAASVGAAQPYVLNSRGNVRVALGRYEDALADYRAAAESFRSARNVNGAAYADGNAALVLVQMGSPGGAAAVSAVARRAPGSVDMRVAHAALQWAAGEPERAEASWVRPAAPVWVVSCTHSRRPSLSAGVCVQPNLYGSGSPRC